jgi:predicted amidohydrolase YtcJ
MCIKYKIPALILVFFFKQVSCIAQMADIIFTNGKIFTSDPSRLYVQAVAIKGNKIVSVGSNASIEKFASIVPGFNDAHDHLGCFIPVGQSFFTQFSVPGPSKEAVVDSLVRLVKKAAPNQWIQGTIGVTIFNDTSIRRRLLDSIAPNNPVALQIMWGHGMILNSKALKTVGISDTAADPLAGWYERTAGTKQVTGVLYEGAQFPVWQAIPVSERANTIKALRAHAAEEVGLGITTVQNMSNSLQGNAARQFFAEADLPVRTRIIAMPGSTDKGRSLEELINTNTRLSPYTYASGIKYVIDGTPLEQNALMTKPYPNRSDWYGRLNFPIDTIKRILKEALTGDRQLMMHVVGDSATKVVLKLMKQMAGDNQWKEKRVRIEHGTGILTDDVIKEVNDMGIIIVHTPQYGMGSPLHKWLSTGIHIAVGPDALINPCLNILMMTTQQANPIENLTREQAVIAYTHEAAYAEFAEKEKGTLAKGMLADLTVLSQDIFTIPAQQLPATVSVMTVIDGKIVYQSSQRIRPLK